MDFDINVKEKTAVAYLVEFSRVTKDGYLFDEVGVKEMTHTPIGWLVKFDYERHMDRVRDLSLAVSDVDFAEMRAQAKTKADMGKSRLVARLFGDGFRLWNEQHVVATPDLLADMNFVEDVIKK